MKKLALVFALVALTMAMVFAGGSAETAAEKEIEIKFVTWWVGADTKAGAIQELVDEFNANHVGKIKVTIEGTADADGLANSISTQIAAGNPPDVFCWGPTVAGFENYDGNLFMDFTEDLKGEWSECFADGILDQATYHGMTKSLPYDMAYTPIWYNTNILKEAGVEKLPETMDEFWDMCDKVKAAGYYPTAQMTGGNNAWTSMLWYTFLCGSIGGPAIFDNFEQEFPTNPVFVQAAEILQRMYLEYTHNDAIGGDAGVAGGYYLAGKTAAFINGPWYIGRVKNEAPEVFEATEMGFFPTINNEKIMVCSTLTNLAAANQKDPAKRAAVIEFLKWLTTAENAKKVAESSGAVLAVKFDASGNDNRLTAQVNDIINGSKGFVNYWQFYVAADMQLEFGQALAAMGAGKITPAEFVAQISSLF
ncbi:MAG: carbohydrate ABC transporter substrate-binding protein [Spirochaetales bacterium]|nr:carbohydrate ABC transporter substrate-binding protein [Spirochaetales bacterium]